MLALNIYSQILKGCNTLSELKSCYEMGASFSFFFYTVAQFVQIYVFFFILYRDNKHLITPKRQIKKREKKSMTVRTLIMMYVLWE